MASFDLIEQLESQLLEKEQLIVALTTSLEQAANELDRAHRQLPLDRVGKCEFKEEETGDPEEPTDKILREIREQSEMLHEIREAVRLSTLPRHDQRPQQDLHDPAIDRVENQLQQIRELIESQTHATPEATLLPVDWKESLAGQMSKLQGSPFSELLGIDDSGQEKPDSGSQDLEKSDGDADAGIIPSVEQAAIPQEKEVGESHESHQNLSENRVPVRNPPQLIESIPEPPQPIDVEAADLETLRQAVLERDEFILSLQDCLNSLNLSSVPDFDLKDYDDLPPAQREKLEHWESILRENLRRTEVEISMDRARLAREQQKLQFQQLQLAKERKRLGNQQSLSINPDSDVKKSTDKSGQGTRTWLNLFHRHETTEENPRTEEET